MKIGKPERLFQLGFGEDLKSTVAQDVTPEGFAGLEFDQAEEFGFPADRAGRFVREVAADVIIKTVGDAAHYLLTEVYAPFEDFDQEEMWVLLLNSRHRITHEVMVYRGTVSGVYLRAAELFKPAVWFNAPALVMAHNHPSGMPDPSLEDVRLTKQIAQAAKALDIDLVDHLIVGRTRCVSMKERGLF